MKAWAFDSGDGVSVPDGARNDVLVLIGDDARQRVVSIGHEAPVTPPPPASAVVAGLGIATRSAWRHDAKLPL
jgi:hypothetical protein